MTDTATSPRPRLLAVDLSAVFRRNWHGGQTEERAILPDGRGYWAVQGTVQTIVQTMRAADYTHLLIAAEASGSGGSRRDLYPAYKAHRPAPDAEMVAQSRDCWNVMAAAGWPVVAVFRKEADDVLAAAAACFEGDVDILTGDRDLLALCSERVRVLLFRHASTSTLACGVAECMELMSVRPEQVCELKALAGDASDGIPGVSGIGTKGAVQILTHYETLRAAYTDPLMIGVPARHRAVFAASREQALLSWRLARLDSTLAVADRWQPIDSCFGSEAVQRVSALGFSETSRAFRVLPRRVEAR